MGFLKTDVKVFTGMFDRAAGGMLKNRWVTGLSERAWLSGVTGQGITKGERLTLGLLTFGEHAQNLTAMWLTMGGVTTLARGGAEVVVGDRWNAATKDAASARVGEFCGLMMGKIFSDPRSFYLSRQLCCRISLLQTRENIRGNCADLLTVVAPGDQNVFQSKRFF